MSGGVGGSRRAIAVTRSNSGILSLFASVVMRVIVIADDGIQ
jgi:uncharacterized membrane protein